MKNMFTMFRRLEFNFHSKGLNKLAKGLVKVFEKKLNEEIKKYSSKNNSYLSINKVKTRGSYEKVYRVYFKEERKDYFFGYSHIADYGSNSLEFYLSSNDYDFSPEENWHNKINIKKDPKIIVEFNTRMD